MASLSTAVSRTTGLVVPGAVVVAGSLAASMSVDFMKNNVFDMPVKGGDAVYPVVATLLLNTFMSGRLARLASLGMISSSVSEVARAYGLV